MNRPTQSRPNVTFHHTACNLSLLALVCVAAGCEPMERPTDFEIDCAAEDAIIFNVPMPTDKLQSPEKDTRTRFDFSWEVTEAGTATNLPDVVEDGSFFCFSDPTIGGYPTNAPWPSTAGCPKPPIKRIAEGPFCQRTDADLTRHHYALHLQAGHHDFWGGRWANWNMNGGSAIATITSGVDAAGNPIELHADGVAFWAKKSPGSDSIINVVLLDDETAASNFDEGTPGTDKCAVLASGAADPNASKGAAGSTDPNVQTNAGSTAVVSDPLACGNAWTAQLTLTEQWKLHLIPWSAFYQDLQPNRESKPLDPVHLHQLALAYRTGQTISMWFDEAFLYKKK